jgi:hypothetical protein
MSRETRSRSGMMRSSFSATGSDRISSSSSVLSSVDTTLRAAVR